MIVNVLCLLLAYLASKCRIIMFCVEISIKCHDKNSDTLSTYFGYHAGWLPFLPGAVYFSRVQQEYHLFSILWQCGFSVHLLFLVREDLN